MTLESLIAEVNAAGFSFNNLFETAPGKWQCNLRTADDRNFAGYGYGASPVEAVAAAFDQAKRLPKDPMEVPGFLQRAPAAAAEVEDILS